ncbi:MAG: hypothetical protein ACTSVI_04710 [Promethearchaeota archaeon]
MLIINLKEIDDFREFLLKYRLVNHVFYEPRSDKDNMMSSCKFVVISFLATMGSYTVLVQLSRNVPGNQSIEDFIADFKNKLNINGISLVKGSIREIYFSIS